MEFILTLDDSIPAYRVARAEASKRLRKQKSGSARLWFH